LEQEELEGQLSQPHPQEDLPFFLSFIFFNIIRVTIKTSMISTMIVPILEVIHAIIAYSPKK
jgi:hypothetical protein